ERSEDWSSFDRSRLEKQVLEPVRRGQPARFQRYDWGRDTLGEWVTLLPPKYLIVEGIGVLHPDLMKYLDYGIWIDVPLEVAVRNGKARDRSRGNDHDQLWDEVWGPNDRDYFDAFRPDRLASEVMQLPRSF